MFIVLTLMIIGVALGLYIQSKPRFLKLIDPLVNIAIYLLLFLLGISVGINETVINNLGTLGIQALLITLGGIVGSVVVSSFVYLLFFRSKE